jgi:uncharacterized protein (DUF2267 family)
VLHALRDRLTIQQSFHLMAQLPIYLKIAYVDSWKYREQPVLLDTQESFTAYVKTLQGTYGEYQFNWPEHTGDLVKIIYRAISQIVDQGEIRKVMHALPDEIKQYFDLQEAKDIPEGGNIRYDMAASQEDVVTAAGIASGNIRVGTGVEDTNQNAGEEATANTNGD